jgi:succinyl-diaminopimelate desuccinylase
MSAERAVNPSLNRKSELLNEARRRMPEFKNLLCDLIRIPTDNPPGDTTKSFRFLRQVLESRGIKVVIHEPKTGNPNLVCQLGTNEKRHLVLNGHIDQFPVAVPEAWTSPPYSGEIREHRIFGRGACDMKAGSTASLICFMLAHEHDLAKDAKLTLTLVSDEETGGVWGAQWLLEQFPGITGTAAINGEPSGTDSVVIGHKGINWLKLRTYGKGGHGALASSKDNAIEKMLVLVETLKTLQGRRVPPPPGMDAHLQESRKLLESSEDGKGLGWIVDSVSISPGVISGGVKVNVIPQECEMSIDMRAPVGMTHAQLESEVLRLLASATVERMDWKYDWELVTEPVYTPPDSEIVQLMSRNVAEIVGKKPVLRVVHWGADTRLWQYRGVPVAIYGPPSRNMGGSDEYVLEEDFEHVVLAHYATTIDYLTA